MEVFIFMLNITEMISKQSPYRNCIEIIYLLAIIPISFIFPVKYAWENGPIENTQACILFVFFIINVYFYFKIRKKLWITASIFFFLLLGRELSWGRVFFPLGMSSNGPIIMPMSQFPHHTLINIIVGICIFTVILGLIFTIPYRQIVFHKIFPVAKFIMLAITVLLSTIGDHGYLFSNQQSELIEELSELLMYFILFCISYYYYNELKQ